MRFSNQARLAIAAAALGVIVFAAANVHLIAVAFESQPDCVLVEGSPIPAKKAC